MSSVASKCVARGVVPLFNKRTGSTVYRAQLTLYLGIYRTPEEAYEAVQAASKERQNSYEVNYAEMR